MTPVVLAGLFNFASRVSGKLHTPHRYVDLFTGSLAPQEGGCVTPTDQPV